MNGSLSKNWEKIKGSRPKMNVELAADYISEIEERKKKMRTLSIYICRLVN